MIEQETNQIVWIETVYKTEKPPTPTYFQLGEQLLFYVVPARLKAPR